MTREEALSILKEPDRIGCNFIKSNDEEANKFNANTVEALNMAISALSENKGEWIKPIQDDGMSDPIYYQVRCSRCGFDIDPQTWYEELHQFNADNFCPNCGADMRGEK